MVDHRQPRDGVGIRASVVSVMPPSLSGQVRLHESIAAKQEYIPFKHLDQSVGLEKLRFH
jgi:hypothetical protein